MNNVLISLHWMMGVDAHKEVAPPPTPPAPFYPHFTTASLRWILRPALAESVQCHNLSTMQRGTDIQSGIPHVPIPPGPYGLLSPLYTTFSGSKSHFGVASVLVENKAIAVAVVFIINVNLNCGDIPTPTGFVIAPNTVTAQMTFADWLGGVLSMAFDCLVQAALSRIMGGFGVNTWTEGIISVLIGTPLGFSANANGKGLVGIGGRALGAANDYVRGWGESWGGDEAQGQATRDAAVESLKNVYGDHWYDFYKWDVGRDLQTIFDRPIQAWNALPSLSPSPGPSPASSALDSPDAEQF